jgi:hypothetical protein
MMLPLSYLRKASPSPSSPALCPGVPQLSSPLLGRLPHNVANTQLNPVSPQISALQFSSTLAVFSVVYMSCLVSFESIRLVIQVQL